MQRRKYLKKLYKLTGKHGKENVVYFDESGFKANTGRLDGWAKRGQKIYADVKVHNVFRAIFFDQFSKAA